MSAARRVLERLLDRAESARLRGDVSQASLPMDGKRDAAEYLALRTLPELEAFHAQIALAERDGAIHVERDAQRGDGERLRRLTVADLSALARHLGVLLLAERVARAAVLLDAWTPRFPVVADVLDAWRKGRKVRGFDAADAGDLADAARAVAAREADAGHERILRRESVRVFGDSKRLEKLTPWLDVLVTGELVASGLSEDDVWSALGLRREPQPVLLAGDGEVELDGGRLTLPRPYVGLPVESLRALATRASYALTVENLASFHDAARAPGAEAGLLIYTGGMPSPAWRAAYARILGGLPPRVPVFHWGDVDEGGFRIAAVLAKTCAEAGRTLKPWRMSPDDLPDDVLRTAARPSPATLAAMCRGAQRAGWNEVAQALRHRPVRLEQEALDPALPAVVAN